MALAVLVAGTVDAVDGGLTLVVGCGGRCR
jgi:hypothetical protein